MKIIFLLITFFSLINFTGCASYPKDDIEVDAQADPKVKFSDYKTYAWLASAGILNDPQRKWKSLKFDADAEVMFNINHELRNRGMTESTNNPDLLIAYGLGVDMATMKFKINLESKIQFMENVPKGALFVIMTDARTGYVVWLAGAMSEIKNLAPDIAKKRIGYAITEMFSKLPN